MLEKLSCLCSFLYYVRNQTECRAAISFYATLICPEFVQHCATALSFSAETKGMLRAVMGNSPLFIIPFFLAVFLLPQICFILFNLKVKRAQYGLFLSARNWL
jgi:hypothetical protein